MRAVSRSVAAVVVVAIVVLGGATVYFWNSTPKPVVGGTSVNLSPEVPLVQRGQSVSYPAIDVKTTLTGVFTISTSSGTGISLAPNETSFRSQMVNVQMEIPAVLTAGSSVAPGAYPVNILVKSGGTLIDNVTLHVQVVSALVVMKGAAFIPEDITVPKGTTVWWVNLDSNIGCCDPGYHTVTFIMNGNTTSPILKRLDTWSYTFGSMGVVDYHCTIHPYMTGEVDVTA